MKFTLSNVFSGASSALGRGFVPLLLASLMLYTVPNQAVYIGMRLGLGVTIGTAQAFQPNVIWVTIAAMVVTYFLTFMHMSAIYEICVLTQARKPVKLGEVCAHAFGNAVPIFVIYVLCALGWAVGGVLLLIPALIFGTLFSVVIPAYVTEKPGIFGAFSRSRALTKGHRWGVFGLWVLMVILFYIAAILIELPVLAPMMKASMQARLNHTPVVPPMPSLVMVVALSVAFSAIWVIMLSINASVYSCLRAEKDTSSAASVEKVFE